MAAPSLDDYGDTFAGQNDLIDARVAPVAGLQVYDRVSERGVTGYGAGTLRLTPEGAAAVEIGVSMAMDSGGSKGGTGRLANARRVRAGVPRPRRRPSADA